MTKRPAGFFLRLLAYLVENQIFLLPATILVSEIALSTTLSQALTGLVGFLTMVVFVILLGTLYNLLLSYYFGGVLGKLLTGLVIGDENGNKLEFKRLAFRQLIAYRFSVLVFGLGYFSILKDPKKQAWHDKTIGSNVFVRAPLWPLAMIVFVVLLLVNIHFIQLSIKRSTAGPLRGQILGIWSGFQSQAEANRKAQDQSISPKMITAAQSFYAQVSDKDYKLASASAQQMKVDAKTSGEKALALQVTGDLALVQGDTKSAKNYYLKSLDLSQELFDVYDGLGVIALRDKDYKQAITYAEKAQALSKDDPGAFNILGNAYYFTNDQKDALIDLEKATQLAPNNQSFKDDLAALNKIQAAAAAPVKTNTPAPATPSSPNDPGYTRQDIDNLVNDLNEADKITASVKALPSNYNQQTIAAVLQLITQRKAMAQQLLNKMGKGENLTQADIDVWNQYITSQDKENSLLNSFYNSNGGN